ncbi:hypothetical protein GCM10010975_24770 [Comamonas phosphati]|nr:hypothetical protein GCM10010975_24770 [Comamonas phosphati]
MSRRLQPALGALLCLVLLWPGVRHAMEASMWRHMLLQFPLWMLAGGLLAARVPAGAGRWNAHGISGLIGVAALMAVLMVPRLLDMALQRPMVEAAKLAALLLGGAALRLSWRPAGLVLQFFFLGNVLPMMAVAGQLYADSPLRLCNAYLQDDQIRLGQWLTALAALLALAWLAGAARQLMRRDAQADGLTGSPARAAARSTARE